MQRYYGKFRCYDEVQVKHISSDCNQKIIEITLASCAMYAIRSL